MPPKRKPKKPSKQVAQMTKAEEESMINNEDFMIKEGRKYYNNKFFGKLNDKKHKQQTRKQEIDGTVEEVSSRPEFFNAAPSIEGLTRAQMITESALEIERKNAKRKEKPVETPEPEKRRQLDYSKDPRQSDKENIENDAMPPLMDLDGEPDLDSLLAVPSEFESVPFSFADIEPMAEDGEEIEWDDGATAETDEDKKDLSYLLSKDSITVELSVKKRAEEILKRRGITKEEREWAANMHKAHLICLIGHQMHLNKSILNDNLLQSVMMSMLPKHLNTEIANAVLDGLIIPDVVQKLILWFNESFKIPKKPKPFDVDSDDPAMNSRLNVLLESLHEGQVGTRKEGIWAFSSLCRALGIPTRLVHAFYSHPKADMGSNYVYPYKPSVSRLDGTVVKQEKKEKMVVKKAALADFAEEWVELYLHHFEDPRWTHVDLWGKMDTPHTVEDKRNVLLYAIAIDQQGKGIDVTRRYCSRWNQTKGNRVEDDDWMSRILNYQIPSSQDEVSSTPLPTVQESEEHRLQRELEEKAQLSMVDRDFPTSQEGFRKHPLYVLERFVSRYQILHPKKKIGDFKGIPVYSRTCIKELHTADKWLQQGRIIKLGEQPTKYVRKKNSEKPPRQTRAEKEEKEKEEREKEEREKAEKEEREKEEENEKPKKRRGRKPVEKKAPKRKKKQEEYEYKEEVVPDGEGVNLYGEWQTELYEVQVAEAGIVPRNGYGNVYLFKPEMIPKGCAHVNAPGMNKLAKRLGIDFAPAMVDWEHKAGKSHPKIDGIVICSENQYLLQEAWEMEQALKEEERLKKKQLLVLKRWKKLTRGILIRSRLNAIHGDEEGDEKDGYAHRHSFAESSKYRDEETGQWKKKCSCGLEVAFEEM